MSADLAASRADHGVVFYETDLSLVVEVTDYLASGLRKGNGVLVVATPQHRASFLASLSGDLRRRAGRERRLVVLDARETLDLFMHDGLPDPIRFEAHVGQLVRELRLSSELTAYGEMVALLWAEGNVVAALKLEQLWNDLQREVPFALLCAYPMDDVRRGPTETVAQICGCHSAVVGGVRDRR